MTTVPLANSFVYMKIIKHLSLIIFGIFYCQSLAAQNTTYNPKFIFDVHLHATNQQSERMISGLNATIEHHQQFNVKYAALSVANQTIGQEWLAKAPNTFLVGPSFPCADGKYPVGYDCFAENGGWPDIEWLRSQYEKGTFTVMGELLYVYYGIPPTDAKLAPYFELAHELNIPIGVHAGHGPPKERRLPTCCPNFNEELGNPLMLEPILKKYPGLKIWLMHGGEIRFHKQAISLMKKHPNVYADLSILNSVMPEEMYHQFLKSFIDAGLEDQLMFGSDNLPIPMILERLQKASFLSDMQKDKLLFKNALQFFQLESQ